ncbi:9-O-acetylesterase [Xanthomonas sp. NCPPB 1128]|uniref:sialate O-acetylesterase n=1 Tax=Xanthomonas sp. NCPPB 1128 TaxID=1775876 RepID=UPI00065AF0B6|nr:sialate O-acetylesterase [Xanthomonas sp. NCPPB 1128]KMM77623.1 9-O-acetylesterase [Xanthomonas sp. NCPPB 1128]
MAVPLLRTVRRLALLALAAASWPAAAALELPLLVADGAVLQRDAPIPVWGWATPGARIQVRLDGASASTVAGADGRWQLQLPAHAAGGPYVLEVQGDGSQRRIGDVLIGDVWLASGQSNMEWPLAQARDGAREVAAATDPQLRNFKVPKAWAAQPQPRLPGGSWVAATPATAGAFSAVAYFFARDLRQHTGVPIGIIDSSWGGSAIEAWMDAASPGVDTAQVRTRIAQMQAKDAKELGETKRRLARWPQVTDAQTDTTWAAADLDDRDWDRQPLPGLWEQHGYVGMDGVAWYRTTFTLSAAEAKAGAVVGIGPADDADTTYVNGVEVGHTEGRYTEPRRYRVPPTALRAGINHVAIRILDTGGFGGIPGDASAFFVQPDGGQPRSLAGDWQFRPGKVTLAANDDKNQIPTLLYNAMIHPLQPFPVKGVIWYQGESNAYPYGALRYREQFAAMIRRWRQERGQPQLPFLWVQLANWKAGNDQGDLSPWAQLRESQTRTLALPATGQAVTIDIGMPDNIHPTNKQDVGHRLALVARHVAYGETLVYSAPVFARATFADGQARAMFDMMGSALAVRGGGSVVRGFALAGADRRFHPAQARIEGDQVVVRSDAVPQPQALRYAWSENPEDANLVNREQLPVGPFRTDSW